MFYKIIWFFELDPSSLCGNTIALRTTTSPGIDTLLPKKNNRISQTINFSFFFRLPITVIDGWSLPSWNNESCSIFENCLFGSGSKYQISFFFFYFLIKINFVN